ncbi:MAG: carbamoyltransferase HypF [Caldisericia bacterium]
MTKTRRHLKFSGIVQGVGFRPFVYRVAKENNLCGWVRNIGDGVEVLFIGEQGKISRAIHQIKFENPPLARIDQVIELPEIADETTIDFTILKSPADAPSAILVPPDIAICDDCKKELQDPENPRYRHPLISCTNCGPRMTILKDLPYDRHTITQGEFELCEFCKDEYSDPENRRYHAQTISCKKCGPKYFYDGFEDFDAIEKIKELILAKEIVAIKGIGGYHLACLAKNFDAVKKLRELKKRGDEPLAVMVASLEDAKKIAEISEVEEKLLTSWQAPIVLLEKSEDYNLAENIAPDTNKIGIFLPYTPLHVLLMEDLPPIVLTSANLHDEPIASSKEDIIDGIPILSNNRVISHPIDDSVCDIIPSKPRVLRRARGFVPETISIETKKPVLALGPQMKSTFCFAWDNQALVSQHIGELSNPHTFERYSDTLKSFRKLFGFKEEVVAYDMHPGYTNTIHKNELTNITHFIPIQHHHAHIVSVMAEYDLHEPVIGISADGTGYGTDGTIWGFEFLVSNRFEFVRAGHLKPFKLPGGDAAVKDAGRIAYSLLSEIGLQDKAGIEDNLAGTIPIMLEKNINSPTTSSLGRLFDAFSYIAGLGRYSSFEAQLAIKLESQFDKSHPTLQFPIVDKGDHFEIDWRLALTNALSFPEGIPGGFHKGIVMAMINGARILRDKTGIRKVALSGGCFANKVLTNMVFSALTKMGFIVYINHKYPPGDGNVSLGQAVIATEILKKRSN